MSSLPQWTNWAGNLAYSAARRHEPGTVAELQSIVRAGSRVRALGSRHSFNRVADTDGDLVSTAALPPVLRIAEDRRTVRVGGGVRYAVLAERLWQDGLALANLASLPHISVAGAVATGTHGSGDRNQGLASAVQALRLVGASGELEELSRDTEPRDFPGAVVALGALGVVTELTLAVRPAFEVAQRVWLGLPLPRLAEEFEQVFGSAYSVSAFTTWGSDRAAIWRKERTDAPAAPPVAGAVPATDEQHPIPGLPAGPCTAQLGRPGPWHERLPHFKPEFTPSSGDELQSEYLLPRAGAAEAITRLRALGDRLAPVLHVGEIRTVAADDLWLSPAYGRDSVAFHFTWIADLGSVEPVLAQVEAALRPLAARPHWGKLSAFTPGELAAAYPRLTDFTRLAQHRDPHGRFGSPFLDALIVSGPA
ncbi:D-arabinono-1,4-lactone oxidase [Streptacidiphilus sp. P02-A3a]|uniref:D-arabinono-1,4-lactone oxidase n=1 Tax=Streptacidiphilus sp. P02-A3a TaxID=2704468 RepID=UPI0015FC750D|nr:D-arabinono-1,4-lactone oxidase [Streptacidiphilus sp. P02-A3a]QMU71422.1 FAD-binding protein [Streptacidiphilus sp. P02-A3a]